MDDDPLSLTVAAVGPFTRALASLEPGVRLWVRGPFGHGFPRVEGPHLLIGGGSGSASLALLAKAARARGQEVVAVVAARAADLLMLPWRFEELGCQVIVATDDGSRGLHGTALDAASYWLDGPWPDVVHACGPEPMLLAVARRCTERQLPCWVAAEREMKCGLGVCGHCHCGELLVCQDGPVFTGEAFLRACGDAPERAAPPARGDTR
jgi:dihydroorotate dehydrogenase electron transfer subunit